MSIVTIKNDFLTVSVKTFGAELTSVKDNQTGKEYIWQGNPAFWEGQCPVLFPIASTLRNNGENKLIYKEQEYELMPHGFASHMDFEIESQNADNVTLLIRSNDFTRTRYPFEFVFRVVYKLEGRKLVADYITDNTGEEDLYYSTGAHEGFATEGAIENYSIVFDEAETLSKYECMAEGGINPVPVPILSGERAIKLCEEYFTIDALIFFDAKSRGVALRDDRTGEEIHVSFPECETLLIWRMPHAEYVCIEPWAGAPDLSWMPYHDFSEKYRIRKLAAGETEAINHTITF